MTSRRLGSRADTVYPPPDRRLRHAGESGRATTSDEIVRVLRRAIVRGELRPGSLLVQAELAARFGVSRIPLREALRALDAEGLVVMKSGRGATVTSLTSQDAFDLYRLRLAIEPPLAGRIVEYAGPRDLLRLHEFVEALDLCGEFDQQRFSDLNLEFHITMYRIADRPAYTRFVERALASIEPYSRMYLHLLRGTERAQSEHIAMVQAIENREADTLARLIASHLDGARKALVDHLAAVESGENLPPEIYGSLWTAEGESDVNGEAIAAIQPLTEIATAGSESLPPLDPTRMSTGAKKVKNARTKAPWGQSR